MFPIILHMGTRFGISFCNRSHGHRRYIRSSQCIWAFRKDEQVSGKVRVRPTAFSDIKGGNTISLTFGNIHFFLQIDTMPVIPVTHFLNIHIIFL